MKKTKFYTLVFSMITLCFGSSELVAQCEAGTLNPTGPYMACDGIFSASAGGEVIPAGGGYGWFFDNTNSNGTGGTGGAIILSGAPTQVTYDAGLNGVLAANNLPDFAGTWVIFGAAYSNASNPNGTVCSITTDSLLVTFGAGTGPTIALTDNGTSISSMVTGGVEPYTYAWTNGETGEELPNPASDELYGLLITDAAGCNAFASIYASPSCIAGTLTTAGEYTLCEGAFLEYTVEGNEPPTGGGFGWVFDNANTNGTGGVDEATFILTTNLTSNFYTSTLNNILTNAGLPGLSGTWAVFGASYTDATDPLASVCNFTMDSMLVTFTTDPAPVVTLASADNMTITSTVDGMSTYDYVWTTGETTESITVNMDGVYFVTVTDTNSGCSNVAAIEVFPSCAAGELVTNGIVCTTSSFTLEAQNSGIPTDGGYAWLFENATSGGTGGTGAGLTLTGASAMETFDAGLNGILAANSLPDLAGTWVVYGLTYSDGSSAQSAVNSICSGTTDSLVVNFVTEDLLAVATNNTNELSVQVQGNNGALTYEWSTGETTEMITAMEDGTFTVTVTDALGCMAESSIDVMGTAVEDVEGLLDYSVYPNPIVDQVFVQLSLNAVSDININLVNTEGKVLRNLVRESSQGQRYQFDLSDIPTGLYFLQYQIDEAHFTEQIFIEK